MTAELARICRFPVKGLSVEDLDRVTLTPDRPLPGDRRFAIARGSARLDTEAPEWAGKENFVSLMRVARLAQLSTRYNADTGELVIRRGERPVARGKPTEPTGRTVIDQFLAAFLKDDLNRTPKLIDAAGGAGAMTDVPQPVVSLINLASVRDLTRVAGKAIDPIRFRGNLLLEGLPAWVERDWIGATVEIGGTALRIEEPIERCAAVDVNPATAERDTSLPKLLMRGYGQNHMGVYARVVTGGEVNVGDPVTRPA